MNLWNNKKNQQSSEEQNIINQFKRAAQLHVKTTNEIFNIVLDYSENSILIQDQLIQDGWGSNPPNDLQQTVLFFGSYIGESIINNLGGYWEKDQNLGWVININGMKVSPFVRTRKRFLNGQGDSISYWYQVLKNEYMKNK